MDTKAFYKEFINPETATPASIKQEYRGWRAGVAIFLRQMQADCKHLRESKNDSEREYYVMLIRNDLANVTYCNRVATAIAKDFSNIVFNQE